MGIQSHNHHGGGGGGGDEMPWVVLEVRIHDTWVAAVAAPASLAVVVAVPLASLTWGVAAVAPYAQAAVELEDRNNNHDENNTGHSHPYRRGNST